jgi:type 1 glutamine amidotransferase
MMTGVFHFIAISLGPVIAARKLRVVRTAVNRQARGLLAAGSAGLLIAIACFSRPGLAEGPEIRFNVLVFTKTADYRHDSIRAGIATVRALGNEHGFAVDSTEDAAQFNEADLTRYKVVVFLNTTGDILDADQKAAFERYIRSGGSFVGVHSASDTEYRWPWYGQLLGAWFASHPQIQRARVHVADPDHPSTKGLPTSWERTDEWYNFRENPRGRVRVLATVDETTYSGGAMGGDHPISWCHSMDRGRSWYTAMGHTTQSYDEPLFRRHLLGGIESAARIANSCEQ